MVFELSAVRGAPVMSALPYVAAERIPQITNDAAWRLEACGAAPLN
jgi:hypothetical protein